MENSNGNGRRMITDLWILIDFTERFVHPEQTFFNKDKLISEILLKSFNP
jgi:hypothetical protein